MAFGVTPGLALGGLWATIGDAGPASSVTLLDHMATNFRAFQSRWMTRPRNPTSDLSSHPDVNMACQSDTQYYKTCQKAPQMWSNAGSVVSQRLRRLLTTEPTVGPTY